MTDKVLDIGAGMNPDSRATETLDIREDLPNIDYPGVDIGNDEWPIESNRYEAVIANHVLEHVSPSEIKHVFDEVDRVLTTGGTFHAVVPHAGTWDAYTDPTHQGTGGWTPDVNGYFNGELEPYFTDLGWRTKTVAHLEFPTLLRPTLRLSGTTSDGTVSTELVKLPLVTGTVSFEATTGDSVGSSSRSGASRHDSA